MANTQDALELKVSGSEYASRMSLLDTQIGKLQTILTEYQALKNDANKVFGDDDQNITAMKSQVEANINAVQGQINMLNEARAMLKRQEEELDVFGGTVDTMIQEGVSTAKSAFRAIKAVNDVAGLIG